MTVATADFKLGTNTNAIAAADAGSATAWTTVIKSAGNTIIYDNTFAAHDTLAAKFDNTTTPAGSCHLQWGAAVGTLTEHYGRVYLYATANPSGSVRLINFDNGGAFACRINLSSAGKLQWSDNTGTAATTNSITLNQWVRIEYHVVHSATVGQGEIKLYNTPDSATVTETLTTAANRNTLAQATLYSFGQFAGANIVAIIWQDNIVAGATAYPGSFPVISVAPSVSGLTPVGSTLTCDGGTWNGTFTLTYQWTKDGSNIGGATSSTYVTVAGDATHLIGCTVTATGQQATNEAATSSSNTITATAVGTVFNNINAATSIYYYS